MPGPRQVPGLVDCVRIGKDQQLAPSRLRPCPAGVRLAGEAGVRARIERRGLDHPHARVVLHKRDGEVGGGIVDHQNLPVAPQLPAGLRLRDQRGDARPDHIFFIARGDDDRERQLVTLRNVPALQFRRLVHNSVL